MSLRLLSSCVTLPANPKCTISGNSVHFPSSSLSFRSLSFAPNLSQSSLTAGRVCMRGISRTPLRRVSIVCEAGEGSTKKPDSAAKRARQAEKRRMYNKARKSEIRTRMRKVIDALEKLNKKAEPQAEELIPIEKLIGEAYSVIDKAIKVGTLHRNTGAHRKSRLARRKKAVEIRHGWYTPVVVDEA